MPAVWVLNLILTKLFSAISTNATGAKTSGKTPSPITPPSSNHFQLDTALLQQCGDFPCAVCPADFFVMPVREINRAY